MGLTVLAVTGAVNLQLPFYADYAEAAGLSAGEMSALLAGYVGALLGTLTLLGGLSDRVGRKAVTLGGVLSSTLATAVVVLQPSALGLGTARWFQGVGVALVMGAATAWIADEEGPEPAARTSAWASTVGFGGGALLTGLERWLDPDNQSVPWSYALWLLVLVLVWGSVAVREGRAPRAPQAAVLRWPSYPPGTVRPALAMGTAWAVSGVVIAVLPGVLGGWGTPFTAGPALCAMLSAGFITQNLMTSGKATQNLHRGLGVLSVGSLLMALGVALQSPWLVIASCGVVGVATHGLIYAGGMTRTSELAPASPRAISGFLIAAYVGFGFPAILVGMGVDGVGASAAFFVFAILITGTAAALR